jgi:hypothetical protein
MTEPKHDIAAVLDRLEHWGREREWVGPDPYEGLNSPLGRLMRGKRPRQAVIQAYKPRRGRCEASPKQTPRSSDSFFPPTRRPPEAACPGPSGSAPR